MAHDNPLTFAQLHTRLLAVARQRIRNGEFTERGLARIAGISQPHLHNLLKGVRELSTASADSLLSGLDIGVLDLSHADELGLALDTVRAGDSDRRMAPVVAGRVGPEWPMPDFRRLTGWRALPGEVANGGRRPAIVRLAPDPAFSAAFPGANEAIFDLDELARLEPKETCWYLVKYRGGGVIRQIRAGAGRVTILGQMALSQDTPESISLGACSILHAIRGRMIWAGSGLDLPVSDPVESGFRGHPR